MQVMENLDVAKNVDTQHTIDYTNYSLSHPSHAFQKILQQSGGTTRIIGNSHQESLFELPTKVFSLADSILSFDVELRNGATAIANGQIRRVHGCGMPFIQGIQLYTRSNLRIVDIVDADKYARVMFPRTHKLEDYLENDVNVRVAAANGESSSNGYMFHRSNVVVGGGGAAGSAFQAARVIAAGSTASQLSYTEPSYFYQGVPEAGGGQGRIHLRIKLPLSAYKNTMLDCSKDMWFGGEVLILKIVWNTLDKVGFQGDDAADLAGAAIMSVNTTTCEVQNLSLYLKVETNPVIARQLIEKMENDKQDDLEKKGGSGFTTGDLMREGKPPSPLEAVKKGVQYVKDKFTKGDGKKHGGPIKKYASGGAIRGGGIEQRGKTKGRMV